MLIMKYSLIIFLVILASCSSKKQDQDLDPQVVDVINSNQNTKNVDLYTSEIKFLALKTKDTFYGDISKMKIVNEKIYILDDNTRVGLYVYNLSGDLIYEYRNKGQAPNQYLQLSDFIVNEDESVELLDSYLQKIFVIDNKGKYMETKEMSFPASDFIKFENSYFFHTNNLEVSGSENSIGLLVKSNLDLTENEDLVPIDSARGEFILNQRGENFFYWNDNAYFMDIFSNEAVSLTSSKPNLKFNFGDNSFPNDFFANNDFPSQGLYLNHIFSNEYAWNLTGFYGFDNTLFFKFSLGMEGYFAFFNEEKNVVDFAKKKSWKSDNPCFLFYSVPLAVYNNKLVFSIKGDHVEHLIKEGCSELQGLKVDDNNILMMMNLK